LEVGDGIHIRHIENVELPNDGRGLGFGIVGSRNSGVVIKTILAGGVADKVYFRLTKIHIYNEVVIGQYSHIVPFGSGFRPTWA
jgi:hypothetical protein